MSPQDNGRYQLLESGAVRFVFTWQDYLREKGIGKRYWDPDPSLVNPQIIEYGEHLEENVRMGRGLVIRGDVGVGKTMSLIYLLRENFNCMREGKGIKAEYLFAPTLFAALHRQNEEVIEKAKRARLILLDDFGREYREPFALAMFEDLVEYWHSNMKAVVVTTNVLFEDINDLTLKRIIDRWREDCGRVTIGGESLRGK